MSQTFAGLVDVLGADAAALLACDLYCHGSHNNWVLLAWSLAGFMVFAHGTSSSTMIVIYTAWQMGYLLT